MQVQIRRISTSSAFLVGMALYGLIGFLVGIALVVVAGIEVPPGTEPSFVERMGVWAIVVVPTVFGIGAGFLHAIAAALYNAVTAVVGGLRVELGSGRASRRERRERKKAEEAAKAVVVEPSTDEDPAAEAETGDGREPQTTGETREE